MLKFFDGQTEGRTDRQKDGRTDRVITIGHPPSWAVGERSRSRSHVPNLWFCWKGLVIRYTHAKYESPISHNKKVMANVKVFQK